MGNSEVIVASTLVFTGSWEITFLIALGLGCHCTGICLAILEIFWFK